MEGPLTAEAIFSSIGKAYSENCDHKDRHDNPEYRLLAEWSCRNGDQVISVNCLIGSRRRHAACKAKMFSFCSRIALFWLLLQNHPASNCVHRPRAKVKVRWTTGANCWIAMSLIHNCSGVVIRCFKHVEHFADWLTGAAGPVFVFLCWLLIGSGGALFCKFHSAFI